MKAWLRTAWARLAESFWLVPTLMAALAVLAALGAVELDRVADDALPGSVWIWSGGADGARSLLSTVGTSMITVAGTVFSITIAALTLASSQFGPRLLRQFTADRGIQVVLGTFIATFLYCLMVLRTVRSTDEGHFVPNIAVTGAVLLACASLGVLIFYIHHVSNSIQAESLLAGVGRELKRDLASRTTPSPSRGHAGNPPVVPQAAPGEVSAGQHGYIQLVDRDELVRLAEAHDLLIELRHRPGDFLSAREAVLAVWPAAAVQDEALCAALRSQIRCGPRRTPLQDVRYGVRQLTEIGSRALSPGINDPFTAMGCIDWLTDALDDIAGCEPPSGVMRGQDGTPRLVEEPVCFGHLLQHAFEPILAYGASSAMVVVHLLEALARLAHRTVRADESEAIWRQVRVTALAADGQLATEADRERVRQAVKALRAAEISPGSGVDPATAQGDQHA